MQLKRIHLVGFKSFVDPTSISVPSHLNAVVGPNGCGKSNIVDAIRWVTGEMSAKQLRGQSMSDVIFSGTSGRKPVGKASVELVFDNSDCRIAGEYAGFSEISIRREVVRDEQSSYFINGVPARRRDLVDLFLGTGLGPRSYAIIEQGMISQLIEAKPEEMRTHLEEVAGISKYRERRRETETRIHHTQENLSRLNDLRDELAKQLQHLQRQSRAAEQYKVLQQDQRLLHAQVKVLQWQNFETQLNEKKSALSQQEIQCEAQLSLQRELETEIEKLRLAQQSVMDEKSEVQKTFYSLATDIARLEQQIQNKQDALLQWKKELQTSAELLNELTMQSNAQESTTESLTIEIEQLKPEVVAHQTTSDCVNTALQDAEKNMHTAQAAWDNFQDQLSISNQQAEVAKNNIVHYTSQQQQLHTRLSHLQSQQSDVPLNQLTSEIATASNHFSELEKAVIETQAELNTLTETIQAKRQAYEALLQTVTNTQGALQQAQARHASLVALQQHREDVTTWMQENRLNEKTRLGKILQVSPGWELAVETILSSTLNAVCVDRCRDYENAFQQLSQGQVTLIEKSSKQTSRLSHNTVCDIVNNNEYLPDFFSSVYIAEDLQSAWALQPKLSASESIITKSGCWIGANWMHMNASHNVEDSFLIREKNINTLSAEIATHETALEKSQQDLSNAKKTLQTLESTRDNAQSIFQQKNAHYSRVQSELSAKKTRLDGLSSQQQRIAEEIKQIESELNVCERALHESEATLSERKKTQDQDHVVRDHLLEEKALTESALSNARNEAQIKRRAFDEKRMQLASCENQLALLLDTLRTNNKQLAQLTERREELQSHIAAANEPLTTWRAQLQTLLQQRVDIEKQLQAVEAQVQAALTALRENESKREGIVSSYNALQEQRQQLKLAQQEVVVRQATLKEQIDELQFNFDSLLQELPVEAELSAWEEKLEAIQRKIDRLGPINLAAIDEFNTLTERKVYMDQQCKDLEDALAILQEAIRKIDRETKHLFKDTFDKLNTQFQRLFPRIFGGGQASLVLTEDDLLMAGVVVRAQPPGKRNSTIHMLSGGEKTLTAIALMFSMFQLNPAPFCVLDEVDAPLDDLNVGRFCHLVKEMSETTQFLVISHNKVTIESADYLMGVTMQEAGVSRIVSVDMQKAVELAQA